jgi:HNH endonuclease
MEFFAEEAVDRDGKNKKSDVAVKGTIQSFFERAKQTSTPGAVKRKLQDSVLTSSDKKRSVDMLKVTPTAIASNAVSPSASVKWSCKLCTLDNSVPQNSLGCYRCQVCDERHVESKSRSTGSSLGPVFESVSANPTAFTNSIAPSAAGPSSEPNVISLVDDDEVVKEGDHSGRGKGSNLTFSVSKNTGRIIIHRKSSGEMLFNFDLHDILTSFALDELSATITHRKRASKDAVTDMFDTAKLSKLSSQLQMYGIDDATPVFEFVRAFLKLGEAEKKFLRESEQTVTADEVNSTVARLMLSHSPEDFNRYVGGAKERAKDNQEKGIASEDDLLVLQGLGCAWCGNKLSSVALRGDSTYCNEECAREGRLKRGGMFASSKLRSAAFAIENGKCSLCGIDAHALFRQVCSLRPAERLNKLLSVNWKLPTTAKAMESLLQDPKEGQFWQVDHKKAVAEGGGGCGLENLRTLCVPCHSGETEKLRGRLKIQHANSTSSSGQQQDIRHAFNRRASS